MSFAAEDRKYVEAVASSLRAAGVSVFYDRYEEAVLWGKNLYDHLRHVYAEAAEYTVIFSSKAYAQNVMDEPRTRKRAVSSLRGE